MKSLPPKHRKTAWTPCQPGTIHKACSDQKHHQDRRLFLQRLTGIGGAAIIVGSASFAFGWLRDRPTPAAGKIACVQVHDLLADYIANRIEDSNLRKRIYNHLSKCSSCQKAYRVLAKKGCCSRR